MAACKRKGKEEKYESFKESVEWTVIDVFAPTR
jgi:hypothetical protein